MSHAPKIDWVPPAPQNGLDKFIGPGATTAEKFLQFGLALVTAALLVRHYVQENTKNGEELSTLANCLIWVLAMDMVGGVITNSTSAAKRWYHRAGEGPAQHLFFIGLHVMQTSAVSYQCQNDPNTLDPLQYFGILYGFIFLSSVIIVFVPLYLQRPVAMWCMTVAIPLSMALQSPRGLEWFIPILSVKLLVSHLPMEAPFQPDDGKKKN